MIFKKNNTWIVDIAKNNCNDFNLKSPPSALKTNNVINVCYSTDQNYIFQMLLSINSLIESKAEKTIINLYVILINVANESVDTLNKLNDPINNVFIHTHIMDKNSISKDFIVSCYTASSISVTTFARFFIQKIWPNVDRILYLDSDTYIRKDLLDLFNTDLQENIFAAVTEFTIQQYLDGILNDQFVNRFEYIRKFPYSKYFNAGVLLIDLNKLKNIDFLYECINCYKNNSETFLNNDQDILNFLYADKTLFVDPTWNNCIVTLLRTDQAPFKLSGINAICNTKYKSIKQFIQNSRIIHFAFDKNLCMKFDFFKKFYEHQSNRLLFRNI